ncbi:hypothetical protein RND81_09G115400 [Saponaria officinalis]|uniref:Endonuclease/exonuclease/phosphatase domain-containing protein n=1 Tax=Saponaria officinalis TaxID=3572 RepID=A0AAW1ILH9_SAPOF
MHTNGRIWIVWNPRNVSVLPLVSHSQFIHCRLTHYGTNTSCFSTFVYASNDPATRLDLWDGLCSLKPSVQEWVVLGDFNVVRDISERISNTLPNLTDIVDFNSCIIDCGLVDLSSSGYQPRPRRFSFLNCWADLPGYTALVQEAWDIPLYGSAMFKLLHKIRKVRDVLCLFHRMHTSDPHSRLLRAKASLDVSCQALQSSPTCSFLLQSHRQALDMYLKLKLAELSMLTQKAKAEKILHYDSNSSVFYARMKERQHSQTIGEICDHQGTLRFGSEQVIEGFLSYYQHLLGGSIDVQALDASDICSGPCLTSADWPDMIKPVSNSEIHTALKIIDINSSPGADGFSSGFFLSSWSIIESDFCGAI